jgi:hypothetical protein
VQRPFYERPFLIVSDTFFFPDGKNGIGSTRRLKILKLPNGFSNIQMIFRLSQKLNNKIKVGTLAALPLHDNPLADWSAHLFVADRAQYILLSNTQSLYSTVMFGKGITNDSAFIERALSNIREFMEEDGAKAAYERFIAPASASVRFAKALNPSVTGSMNDMTKHAAYWLASDVSPFEIGTRLKEIPMSALKNGGSAYGFPRDVFKALLQKAGEDY